MSDRDRAITLADQIRRDEGLHMDRLTDEDDITLVEKALRAYGSPISDEMVEAARTIAAAIMGGTEE